MLIGIAGTIGAGKSTLCKKLLECLPEITGEAWEILPEPVTDNPYLGKFYSDPTRWAFTMQMFMLLKRFESACVSDESKNYIQDRTLQEDRIFAVLAHKRKLMSDEEFETYEGFYKVLSSSRRILRPDIVFYLNVTHETSTSRIQKRGRVEEEGLVSTLDGKEYLRDLIAEYETERKNPTHRGRKWKNLDWNNENVEITKIVETLLGS